MNRLFLASLATELPPAKVLAGTRCCSDVAVHLPVKINVSPDLDVLPLIDGGAACIGSDQTVMIC